MVNVLPSPVLISKPLVSGEPDESGWRYLGVVPACTVTHAQSRNVTAPDPPALVCNDGMVTAEHVVSPPALPQSVLREEWVKSQRADSSLSTLWNDVLSVEKTRRC